MALNSMTRECYVSAEREILSQLLSILVKDAQGMQPIHSIWQRIFLTVNSMPASLMKSGLRMLPSSNGLSVSETTG